MNLRELFESGAPLLSDFMRENCLQACKMLANARVLPYRGLQNAPGGFEFDTDQQKVPQVEATIEATRKDRKPRNTHPIVHEIADAWFKSKFGVAARSQTVFVTNKMMESWRYGDPYVVLPVGNQLETIWSAFYGDMTRSLHGKLLSWALDNGLEIESVSGDEMTRWIERDSNNRGILTEVIHDILEDGKYQKTDLKTALEKADSEIMLICDDVMLIESEGQDGDEVVKGCIRDAAN